MKASLALGLLVAVCFAGAGCGSSKKKPVTLSFTAPTTTTLADVKAGDTIRCGSVGAKVPPPGQGVTGIADGISSSGTIELTWKNGSLRVSCKLARRPAASHPTAAGNKRKAKLVAARLLALFVPPPGAVRSRQEPPGDQGFLRARTFSIGGQNVYRHAFWRVTEGLDSAVAYVKAHPPNGVARLEGSGREVGGGIPANRSLDYSLQQSRGRRPARWIEVTMAALSHGSTGIRVDAAAGWIVPRSPREKVPDGVREIDIRRPHVVTRVTQPAKVQAIVRWFDASASSRAAGPTPAPRCSAVPE